MRKIALLIAVLGASVLLHLYSVPAYAAIFVRAFVSHTGNDTINCGSESAPCLTFAGALPNTPPGGEIDCLDTGDYASDFTITTSLTIDCRGTSATTYNFNTGDGIDINAPGATVVLRGINIGALTAGASLGVNIKAAASVYIEDCVVSGFNKGIADLRTTGLTHLFIKSTIVRNNHLSPNSPGILLAAAPTNSVVIENVQSLENAYGVAVATGNNVVISRSVISANGIAGIEADPGATVIVDNTEITHNITYGIFALGTVALANSDISFNNSSISGATMSYGNNRLLANGGGTVPTPAGGASTDFGQQ
jgi:hypothetical protein